MTEERRGNLKAADGWARAEAPGILMPLCLEFQLCDPISHSQAWAAKGQRRVPPSSLRTTGEESEESRRPASSRLGPFPFERDES